MHLADADVAIQARVRDDEPGKPNDPHEEETPPPVEPPEPEEPGKPEESTFSPSEETFFRFETQDGNQDSDRDVNPPPPA
jgi:hypothetical protein